MFSRVAIFALLSFCCYVSALDLQAEIPLTKSFLSEPFRLSPGGVHKKVYAPIPMPEGHVGLRGLTAEVVDESGTSVPLTEVYLHHWIAAPLLINDEKEFSDSQMSTEGEGEVASTTSRVSELTVSGIEQLVEEQKLSTMSSNGGFCNHGALPAWFGVGAETRKTKAEYPAPFAVETGNPNSIPNGKKLIWWSEVHAIDTRGALDTKACIECRCDMYNTTIDERGRNLPEGYVGGLLCCFTGVNCRVADDYVGKERILYLKYTVTWIPMNPCVVPLQFYLFDVTNCKIEYDVASCREEGGSLADCVDTKKIEVQFPKNGQFIFASGHQHVGATGISLKREDGTNICSSTPIYGLGETAGDEAGYVTGMGTCSFPSNGPKITANESITLSSTYSRLGGGHTGVMGLFFVVLGPEENTYDLDPVCQNREDLLLKTQNDDTWQVSMLGAFGGFLIGFFATAGVAGLAIILMRQERSTVIYTPLSSA